MQAGARTAPAAAFGHQPDGLRALTLPDEEAENRLSGGGEALPAACNLCYTSRMSHKDHTSRQQLEERITHCEHLADTLNAVVADLQKRVLALEAQNRKLVIELRQQREAQDAFRAAAEADERPPHY